MPHQEQSPQMEVTRLVLVKTGQSPGCPAAQPGGGTAGFRDPPVKDIPPDPESRVPTPGWGHTWRGRFGGAG